MEKHIDAIRNTLASFSKQEYKQFCLIAYNFHIKELGKNATKYPFKTFEVQLKNFVDGKTSGIGFPNYNAYMYAKDEIERIRKRHGDVNWKINWKPKTWTDLMVEVTSKVELPPELDGLRERDIVLLQRIVQNLVNAMAAVDEKGTHDRLETFVEFTDKFISNKLDK